MTPTRWRFVIRSCLLIALAIPGVACERAAHWKGMPFTPPRDVSAFAYADSAGQPVTLVGGKGVATLVFFGYTNCPDVCGATLNDWVRVKKALGEQSNRVRFVFITVDPARDTPAVAQRFVAKFDTTFRGVSGDSAETALVQKAFGVAAAKIAPMAEHDYLMGHSSQTFLVNDRGQLLVMYAYASGWDTIAADVRQLLD